MARKPKISTVDDYIAESPPETQEILEALRALVRETAPGVTESISYDMPTFNLNGHYLAYVAAWKKHVSLYPVTAGVAKTFGDEIKSYQSGKGTLKFPLDKPMPMELIRRVIEFRMEEISGNAAQPSFYPRVATPVSILHTVNAAIFAERPPASAGAG